MNVSLSELELTVIGTTLSNNAFYQKAEVTPEMFVDPIYRKIWQVISKLIRSGEPVDSITIMDELKDVTIRNILLEALAGGWSQVMGEAFAARMQKNYIERRIIGIAKELAQDTSNYNNAIKELMAIGQGVKTHQTPIKKVLIESLNHIDNVAQQNGLAGVATGLDRLDAVLGGFHDSDLVVIAARPAMGKTALMINMLLATHCPSGVLSAEMAHTQIGERILAISSGVEAQKLRQGKTSEDDFAKLTEACNGLINRDIWINDQPAPTLDEIINQARKWKLENKVEIIFLDYLQRIKLPGNAPRHEKVGEAVRTLKELARELDIPIVILAQVNRQAEGRRPNMGDLAQSGEIEAEADQIMFLYRDEVYNPQTEDKGIAELLITKNRHGGTGGVKCAWLAPSMQFKNLALTEGY